MTETSYSTIMGELPLHPVTENDIKAMNLTESDKITLIEWLKED